MQHLGWVGSGLDTDAQAIAQARAAGLTAEVGSLPGANLPPKSFDAITLSHTIEHVHDPLATLRSCRELLKPAGRLWIATPNLAGHGHRVFKGYWRGLEPPRHLVLFTYEVLESALREAGFSHVRRKAPQMQTRALFSASADIAVKAGEVPAKGRRALGVWSELGALLNVDMSEELIVVAQ
jgi:SAM-dependent methyltransferase